MVRVFVWRTVKWNLSSEWQHNALGSIIVVMMIRPKNVCDAAKTVGWSMIVRVPVVYKPYKNNSDMNIDISTFFANFFFFSASEPIVCLYGNGFLLLFGMGNFHKTKDG